MRHGLISISDYDIFDSGELTFFSDDDTKPQIDQAWNKKMGGRGFRINRNDTVDVLKELFELICEEFALVYGERLSISLNEGYITKRTENGQTPAKHNEYARIFSQSRSIYIDLLMSDVLLEYAAVFYLWARFSECKEIISKCFIHVLYILDGCCRKGSFSETAEKLELQNLIADHLKDREVVLIGDLYWCMLAFAMCHEIAHIYCRHGQPMSKEEGYEQEFQADAVGYDIYLKLMIQHMHEVEDTTANVFREYLYAAPMILFLFYHDLFTMGYWMYGETIDDTHPKLEDRIEKLLDMSMDVQYDFDNIEGNIVLRSYEEISDCFLEELWYKIKIGKLSSIIESGKME